MVPLGICHVHVCSMFSMAALPRGCACVNVNVKYFLAISESDCDNSGEPAVLTCTEKLLNFRDKKGLFDPLFNPIAIYRLWMLCLI